MIFDVIFNKTALDIAVQNNDIEMIKLLLSHPKIDANHLFISNNFYFLIQFLFN